jgi:hypothetical protein
MISVLTREGATSLHWQEYSVWSRLDNCAMRTWYHMERLGTKDSAELGHEEEAWYFSSFNAPRAGGATRSSSFEKLRGITSKILTGEFNITVLIQERQD